MDFTLLASLQEFTKFSIVLKINNSGMLVAFFIENLKN